MNPEVLYTRTTMGVKFDLERMRRMCKEAGEPQRCAPSVLIAGTNGKGSVAAMWAAALPGQVGLYTSPHLVRFGERVRINGEEADLDAAYEELLRCERACGFELTFFEAATFMAFVTFRAAKVDAMVLEVGMGGRLDATNVAEPSLCIITTIGLDHEEYLGRGIAAIAGEKAGILRCGVPAAVGHVPDQAWQVIAARAHEVGAPLTRLGAVPAQQVALKGKHQQHNAALFALSASLVPELGARVEQGLLARWPGRYDVREAHGMRVVLDGAHNPPAYAALRETLLEDDAMPRPRALIFGATEGREHPLVLLAPLFEHVILCPPNSPRALSIEWPSAAHEKNVAAAFSRAERLACKSVCVTGSLYLVGDAIAHLEGRARDAVTDFR